MKRRIRRYKIYKTLMGYEEGGEGEEDTKCI
jgi:hypothetical protein